MTTSRAPNITTLREKSSGTNCASTRASGSRHKQHTCGDDTVLEQQAIASPRVPECCPSCHLQTAPRDKVHYSLALLPSFFRQGCGPGGKPLPPSLSLSLSLSTGKRTQGGPACALRASARAPAVHRVSNSPSSIFDRRGLGWTSTESKNPPELVKVRDDAIKYNRPQAVRLRPT